MKSLIITTFSESGNPMMNRFRHRNLQECISRCQQVFPSADHCVAVQGASPWFDSVEFRGKRINLESPGSFRKPLLLNAAVRENPGYDMYMMVDADVYLTKELVEYAVANCTPGRLVYPYGDTVYMDETDTRSMCADGKLLPGTKDHGVTIRRQTGLCMAFTPGDFEAVAGFDEAFSGWGAEDDAFMFKFRRKGFEVLRNSDRAAVAYHMFHPVVSTPRYIAGGEYRHNRVCCACMRRMSDEDFADYLAGRTDMDSLLAKYRAMGRLEVELNWRCCPECTLNIDTTIYDIDRSGEMTMKKVLDAVLAEDGPEGILEFAENVLYRIPGLPAEMKKDIDSYCDDARASLHKG